MMDEIYDIIDSDLRLIIFEHLEKFFQILSSQM